MVVRHREKVILFTLVRIEVISSHCEDYYPLGCDAVYFDSTDV
jgi:hypothetical protein